MVVDIIVLFITLFIWVAGLLLKRNFNKNPQKKTKTLYTITWVCSLFIFPAYAAFVDPPSLIRTIITGLLATLVVYGMIIPTLLNEK